MDISGVVFGRLTAIRSVGYKGRSEYWLCQCSCGNTKEISKYSLTGDKSRSCGCLRKELNSIRFKTHGLSCHKIYYTWYDMVSRCHKPWDTTYEGYGGKGITVCERWRESLENFAEDMLDSWFEGATIDRLEGSKVYSPETCRWATTQEQARNLSIRSTNKTGKAGITLHENIYTASWALDGKVKTKSFSINKYGKYEAFRMAVEYRKNKLHELNALGYGYTEYHISQ